MFIVTGANGFIGSQMVHFLNTKGITNIICIDSVTPLQRPQPLATCDYSEFMQPAQIFDYLKNSGDEVQCLFHMGACSDTQEMNIQFLHENNTEYTNQLFQACCKLPQCTFIYASSGAIYGQGDKGFSDSTPPDQFEPLNPYGWSKLNSDIWILEQLKKPQRWYGLRFFNVYGPNEYHKKDMRSVVHKAYHQIIASGKLKLFKSYSPDYADGKQMRDFIYVKDVTEWMWQIYLNKNLPSDIYNMGYGRARTWLDLAKAVFDSLNKQLNIECIDMPETLRPRYQYFTEAKMKKFLAQGMPSPKWSLEEGVEDYVKNYLQKGDEDVHS